MRKKINPYVYPGLDVEPVLASIADIVSAVKESTEVEWADLVSHSRVMDIKDARHLLAYFLRKRTSLTWMKIGGVINKDHATALHAFRRVEEMRDYDPYFKKHVSAINYLINNSN